MKIDYSNEQGEFLTLDLSNQKEPTIIMNPQVYYVNYTPNPDMLTWTCDHTFDQILELYNANKNVVARGTVGDFEFEGMQIPAQTRLFRLHKIMADRIEFTDTEFTDGTMETLILRHTNTEEITVRSLDVH